MLVMAAIAFGLAPSGAKLAYAGGTEPLTLVALRFFASAVGVGVVALMLGRPLTLRLRSAIGAVALGMLLVWNAFGYLSAIHYIPVSLAAALFYTFPIQVGVMATIIGHERLTWARLAALLLGFCGVILAVGTEVRGLDWRGVGFAIGAGTGVAVSSITFERMSRRGDRVTMVLWATISATAVTWTAVLATGGLVWPSGDLGWAGLAMTVLCFAFALVTYYLALPRVGAVRAAMVANLEPVIAITAAMVILVERPTLARLAGVGLILGAILLMHVSDRRRRRADQSGVQGS
jgi:drug/metabolite transporter (DMT)-like permease